MKKHFLLLVTLLICNITSIWSYDYYSDRVHYSKLSSNTVGVCYNTGYSGEVTIPSTIYIASENKTYHVTTICEGAMQGNTKVTAITIPNSVTTIGANAFSGCTYLKKTTYTGEIASWCKIHFETLASNPTRHSRNLYTNDQSVVTKVIIPETVTSISQYAFVGLTSLSEVSIPNSVTTIGFGAFTGCSSLTAPVYNANVFAFLPTNYSGAYTIPDGITSIIGGGFANCSSLTDISIPNSVTSIGEAAFDGCSNLTSVTWNAKNCGDFTTCPFPATQIAIMNFGDSVEYIPAYLCKGMDKLLSLKLPDAVKTIGNNAFDGCTSLKRLTLGNSITSIGNYAFANCTNLPEIALPQSVETIGNYAFSGDVAFTTMLIPDAVTTIR